MTRALARLTAAAALVVAGGLTLPGGAAQAAGACSGTTGVTVVIDYGSSSTTECAPDSSSAIKVLTSVATVTYPPQYQGTVVCQINSVPSQPCQRMPPQSAYWAFFHAPRGGSWTYSSSGVASYDPAPGTVIGFAFGSGGAPSSAPPAPSATSTPKPSPKPSASSTPRPSSSSTPRATAPHATSTGSGSGSGADSPAPRSTSGGSTAGSSASTSAGATRSATAKPRATTTAGTTTGLPTVMDNSTVPSPSSDDEAPQAAHASQDSGTPTSLFAGLGLVGLVGAGAGYFAVRRRAHG